VSRRKLWHRVRVRIPREGGAFTWEQSEPIQTEAEAAAVRRQYDNLGYRAEVVRCPPPPPRVSARKAREATQVPLLDERWFERKPGLH
jgi:hypothetical protein